MTSTILRFTACSLLGIWCHVLPARAEGTAPREVDFSRDVRPILARRCFACHGPDEAHREAGLRLDLKSAALAALDSGNRAVVPRQPGQSEMLRRVSSADEYERMPPAEAGPPLTPAEVDVLRRWIAAGASYAEHWSFMKPVRPEPPTVRRPDWPETPFDRFVLARLDREGLSASPEADRLVLLRRLSFDVRGLPATLDEVDELAASADPDAYFKMVDRYLADPAYGERWGRVWLDLARYADSRGYGSDPLRPHIWRYRDWVIQAFNEGLPFDQFTIEQLAGDLLPDPTLDEMVATAFHRNTMTNTEGGTDDEEFRVAAVRDRVDTTMQVWMGLTMGCAKCHNHKYDPVTQAEYYRFYAFFNQTADTDKPDESPTLPAPSRSMLAEIEAIAGRIATLEKMLDETTPALAAAQATWEDELRRSDGRPLSGRFVRIELPGRRKILSLAEVEAHSGGKNVAPAGTARQSSTAFDGPAALAIDGNTDGSYFDAKSTTHSNEEDNPWWEVDLRDTFPIEKIVVWNRTDGDLESRLAGFRILVLGPDRETVFQRQVAKAPQPNREVPLEGPRSAVPAEILAVIDKPDSERTPAQREQLAAHYRTVAPLLGPVRRQIEGLEASQPKFPALPVMQELPPDQQRPTHVMIRGSFLAHGETVSAGVPGRFHDWPAGAPPNRLGVARWLLDPDNPLTARVAVNRVWARLFGVGLVETEEDFGTQGELPTHQELLDWLAVEFRGQKSEAGDRESQADNLLSDFPAWDAKRLLRQLVTSAVYRQSSQVTAAALERDPRNRLLARGPRFRLDAETVRDQALSLSGLLSRQLGGPSVYPPQPPGLWQAAFNGERTWPTSAGRDRWRRGLYTFWRRTVPYPSLAVFDAPSREICSVRRVHTNTPLQAFVTLNDPVYVEASQALAVRIIREGGTSPVERAQWALRLCLSRPPQPGEIETVVGLYRSELAHFQGDAPAAAKLAADPLGRAPESAQSAELATWTVVASVLLNLDGVLMKG